MLQLIKLELRKNKITTYLQASMWIFIVGLSFCFIFGFIPQIEDARGELLSPSEIALVTNWSNFSMLISIIFTMAFAILSAVMHTRFTVAEYVGKGAILLFSYPQSRSKILFAKCSLVFVFTLLAVLICTTLAILIFATASNLFGILPATFTLSMVPNLIFMSCVCGMLASSVGLIAMGVGFWKKSLIATVVTAIILLSPFGNIVALLPQYSLTIQLMGMLTMLIIGTFIFVRLFLNVNTMEAL